MGARQIAWCLALRLVAPSFVAAAPATAAASARAATPPPPMTKWEREQAERMKNSAPADEYFGRLKMSFLGMNNTFHDAAISSGQHTTDPSIAHRIALAEDALEAWAKKYPRDPQLARTYFLAMNAERKIWIAANQQRAWIYLNRLVELFPTTYFGKLVKRDLAVGFTEHYYAPAEACPTPAVALSPAADPTSSAAASDSVTGDPAAAGQPTATPTVAPTPTPTVAPTPTPGPVELTLAEHHRREILPQPCSTPRS